MRLPRPIDAATQARVSTEGRRCLNPPSLQSPSVIGSQERGALWARFTIPLSIRTCGFPAYGLPMIFLAWLRCLRIADGTAEPVQALSLEPLACPPVSLPG